MKVVLFNFIDDASGNSDYIAKVAISGNSLSTVQVKYLSAASVSQKYNITWAGECLCVQQSI